MGALWPTEFMRLIGERDRARDLAVRLEQEHAALSTWSVLLVRDLESMHEQGAVDLDHWPAAKALVSHVNGVAPCP